MTWGGSTRVPSLARMTAAVFWVASVTAPAVFGARCVVKRTPATTATVMRAVSHVAMGEDKVVRLVPADWLPHVGDQVLEQEVTDGQDVRELLDDALQARQLILDPDLLVSLDAGLVDHREGVRGSQAREHELG